MLRSQETPIAEVSDPERELPSYASDESAWLTSFGIHLVLLFVLAYVTFSISREQDVLQIIYETLPLTEEPQLMLEYFPTIDSPLSETSAISQWRGPSARTSDPDFEMHSQAMNAKVRMDDYNQNNVISADSSTPLGPAITEELPVQGATTVATTGAIGALDRLTHEILVSLEHRPTLVVWLFDQSGSLREEREQIIARFHRVYEELGVIEASKNPAFKKHKDKPLLTSVVAFGEQPFELTRRPTDQIEIIQGAIAAIEDDASGSENIFLAIHEVAEKYSGYRKARNVMIIVFTDEAGDDTDHAEATIDLCYKMAMPVYIVGRPAPFGRQQAYISWRDPDSNFDQRLQWIPVNMGPESLMPERLHMHFILGRGREAKDEVLDSGFGPFFLTRICYVTGGIYFSAHPHRASNESRRDGMNDLVVRFSKFFDPAIMRKYEPNYISPQEYHLRLSNNLACQAVVEASQLSWTLPFYYDELSIRTRFLNRGQSSFVASLTSAQRTAATMQPTVDRICQILLDGEQSRYDIASPRWRASYDLALGRALATKIRVDGYFTILAMAKLGNAFLDPRNNTLELKTDEALLNSSLEELAIKSRERLRLVIQEHANTPWAMLAERELEAPFGWKWHEDYTPPPTPTRRPSSPSLPKPPLRAPPSL